MAFLGADSRVFEQALDELLHAHGAIHSEAHEVLRVIVELVVVTPRDELGVARDHPQRLLQVMRGDVGELFQLLVRARQIGGGLLERILGELARGDVPEDDLGADDPAFGVPHRGFEHVDVGFTSVAGAVFLDVLEHVASANDLLVVVEIFVREILREQIVVGAPDEFGERPAHAFAVAAVAVGDASANVLSENVDGKRIHQRMVERLGIARERLGSFAFGKLGVERGGLFRKSGSPVHRYAG